MKFRLVHILLLACMGFLINCDSSDKVENSPLAGVTTEDFTFVKFDLGSGNPAAFPLPNDVLRNPATGQLAFPAFNDPVVDALIAQVNTLNGFSTSSFLRIPFDGDVDVNSVNGNTVLVIDLVAVAQAEAGLPVNPFKEMAFSWGSDETGANVLYATPVRPLAPGHPHAVVITGSVTNEAGTSVESDSAMLALKGEASLLGGPANDLEPVRLAYQGLWSALEGLLGVSRLFIPAAWTFTTETLHSDLQTMWSKAQEESPTADVFTAAIGTESVDSILNLLGFGAIPHDAIGALTTGSFNAPNYISNPVTGWIQSLENPSRVDINYVATLPVGPSPFGDGTYPTVIYQHGITSFKETGLALANTAALAGFATIAIDLVLHGDRAIDANGDGVIDSSGETFINLGNVLLSRDNNRQSMADLFMLTRMITSGGGDITGDGQVDLNPSAITFTGLSLGGIVGTGFVSVEPNIRAAVLSAAGARVPTLLRNSAAFSGAIIGGLAGFGLVEGTSLFDIYFMFAQAITDDSDPFNYANHTASGDLSGGIPTAVLIQEMIGDGVVPNSATADLARSLNGAQVDAINPIFGLVQDASPYFGSGIYQFESPADIFTAHGALLSPDGGNPTGALQLQMINFLGSALLGSPTIINPHGKQKIDLDLDIFRGIDQTIEVDKLRFFPGRD